MNRKAIHWLVVFLITGVAMVSSSSMAENVSSAFDGRYWGARELHTELSVGNCADGETHSLVIRNGAMWDTNGTIQGIVTSDGFFTGSHEIDGLRRPFEGSIERDKLVGGVTSADGECVWMVRLEKSSTT